MMLFLKKKKMEVILFGVPDLPGCASQGDNLEEAMENIKEAMELYLEDADNEASSPQSKFVLLSQPNP